MRTIARHLVAVGYPRYAREWERVALHGAVTSKALDAWQRGWRYLSLNAVVLSGGEAAELASLTEQFGHLLTLATTRMLADRTWWPELAWPWPALEVATREPLHPHGGATLYGRFDWLRDRGGTWRLVEYNADTPSGGRELSGFEPAALSLLRKHGQCLDSPSPNLARRVRQVLRHRIQAFERQHATQVEVIGVVSTHQWLEDMCSAFWLADQMKRAGRRVLVGDVTDLGADGATILLRGQPIQALYRFYPLERLYLRSIFASVMDAAIDNRLLLLNGTLAFLAQSKGVLAWLWENRADPALGPDATRLVERHLPPTHLARSPLARRLWPGAVVKHVNGREGDSVVRVDALSPEAWQQRLEDGGYVVQRYVVQEPVDGLLVDDWARSLKLTEAQYACVGTFCVGGRFAGFYTRLDGPVTTHRATYVPTFVEVERGYGP